MQTLNDDLNIIQALDDLPNAVGGLTASELKAKFDEGCNIIKTWLNTVMIPALNSTTAGSSGAKEIGISPVTGLTGYTNVQDALAGVMDAFTAGTVLDGSVTAAKLASNAVETAKIKDGNVTTPKIAAGAVTGAKTDFSAGLTIGGTLTQNGTIILSANAYGNDLPATATAGRLFFKKV